MENDQLSVSPADRVPLRPKVPGVITPRKQTFSIPCGSCTPATYNAMRYFLCVICELSVSPADRVPLRPFQVSQRILEELLSVSPADRVPLRQRSPPQPRGASFVSRAVFRGSMRRSTARLKSGVMNKYTQSSPVLASRILVTTAGDLRGRLGPKWPTPASPTRVKCHPARYLRAI